MFERSVRPSDARNLILIAMKANRPIFLWGPPGIGKSDLIKSIGKELDRPVIDMRLLLMEPTDLKGIPFYNPSTNSMQWAKPSELPNVVNKETLAAAIKEEQVKLETAITAIGDEVGTFTQLSEIDALKLHIERLTLVLKQQDAILFLDELVSAPPSVQAAAYQLVLDKKVGEYHLPEGVSIIAAGNRDTDRGLTFRMPTPLANRFIHAELEVNFEDWRKWAISTKIDPRVLGFLTQHNSKLFQFDPASKSKAFATPRSWGFVSDLLQTTHEAKNRDFLNNTLVAGTVGDGIAVEFSQHLRFADQLPLPDDILRGKVTTLKVKEISAMYSLIVGMCYKLNEWSNLLESQSSVPVGFDTKNGTVAYTHADWNANFDFFLSYIMKNFETEMIVMGAKMAVQDYKLPIRNHELKNFKEFFNKYGELILESE